jgi:hypothetical protein
MGYDKEQAQQQYNERHGEDDNGNGRLAGYNSNQNIPSHNQREKTEFGTRGKEFTVQSRLSKNNNIGGTGVNSTGLIKRDHREPQYVSAGMRTGGSPVTGEKPSSKIKSTTGIKTGAGNFFGKDAGKTNKSPKANDFGKKNFNKSGTDKSKDTKKPFNLQFNEYMNKQKTMN